MSAMAVEDGRRREPAASPDLAIEDRDSHADVISLLPNLAIWPAPASAHPPRSARPRRGFALMLVLWLIVVLGTVSAAVVLGTREASALAGNARARVVGLRRDLDVESADVG